jgi:uncharacterized membrane protein
MPHRLRLLRDHLLGTLWFVPSVLVAASLALAVGMVELSARVDAEALARWPRVFGAEPGSSRAILSAIASGMITVAGLSFSLTMVAVTQASTQYTPRVLRNFMADRANQLVLGTFVGIFAYCLVVLRTIRSDEEGLRFVPSLAVVLGIALAIVGIGVLIYFVHHIASTLQASSLVARVARETTAAIDALFPETLGRAADDDAAEATRRAAAVTRWHPVRAAATGYVQAVDEARLLALAGESDRLVRMVRGVGDFVVEGAPVASIAADAGHGGMRRGAPGEARVPAPHPTRRAPASRDGEPPALDALSTRLAAAWRIGEARTVEQDAAFGLRQLVDIALKALSPGINDATTAVSCVDYLGALLVRLADRRIESPVRASEGAVRVLARGPSFDGLLRLACDEIRQNARGTVSVLHRLLTMLADVAEATPDPTRRALIAEQLALVHEAAERTVEAPADRARLGAAYDEVRGSTGT